MSNIANIGGAAKTSAGNEVLYAVEDGIATITLNRPEQHNIANNALRDQLFAAYARAEADDAVKVAILTAAGTKIFCGGLDLDEILKRERKMPPRDFIPMPGINLTFTKPLIAAVAGSAFAGGWLMVQSCDLCIASTEVKFGIPEARAGRGIPWFVAISHIIPPRIAMQLMMTGKPITAQRAYEIGFVNEVVAPDQVMVRARELARDIVEAAPLTVRAAKEMVRLSFEMGRSAALDAAMHIFQHVYLSNDAIEGTKAFREKRKPVWSGT